MEIEFIIKEFEKVLPNNFTVKLIEDFYIKGFWKNEKLLKGIFLGSIDDMLTTNIVASIEFKEIEIILDTKYKIGLGNSTINININKHLFNHTVGEGILDKLPIAIDTEEGINSACQLIQQYIEQEATPFFNYWQDIRDFLPFLETDEISILSDMFSGDALFKKIIIWKLCSHPQYSEFTTKKTAALTQRLNDIPNDKFFKNSYNKYLKILKTLEKTKPLYEWDDAYLIQKPYVR